VQEETISQQEKREEVKQKAFTQTYNLFGLHGHRDNIIALLNQRHRGEPFLNPFTAHLKKIGADKLDNYSKMEFHLTEYNIHLTFKTIKTEEGEMSYPIGDLTSEPDFRLKATKSWFQRLFS
jgi:hypothetical protein